MWTLSQFYAHDTQMVSLQAPRYLCSITSSLDSPSLSTGFISTVSRFGLRARLSSLDLGTSALRCSSIVSGKGALCVSCHAFFSFSSCAVNYVGIDRVVHREHEVDSILVRICIPSLLFQLLLPTFVRLMLTDPFAASSSSGVSGSICLPRFSRISSPTT